MQNIFVLQKKKKYIHQDSPKRLVLTSPLIVIRFHMFSVKLFLSQNDVDVKLFLQPPALRKLWWTISTSGTDVLTFCGIHCFNILLYKSSNLYKVLSYDGFRLG